MKVCVSVSESVAVVKDFNSKRNYETKHQCTIAMKASYGGAKFQRCEKVDTTVLFSEAGREYDDSAVLAIYAISKLFAKQLRSFSEGELVKECFEVVVELVSRREKPYSKSNPFLFTVKKWRFGAPLG